MSLLKQSHKKAVQLPLGRLERSVSEYFPSKHSCHAGRHPSHMERPCVGSPVNSPAGHSLHVTTAQKPDVGVREPPGDPDLRTEALQPLESSPTVDLDNCGAESSSHLSALSELCPHNL